MQPGERKTGAGMIEALGRLPYILIVATQAFRPQLAGVRILVTVHTLPAQTQEGLIQIFHFDFGACDLGNVGGVMTLLTAQMGMLSLQSKSCESPKLIILTAQFGQRKLPTVMLHVAMGAIHLSFGSVIDAGVCENSLRAGFGGVCGTMRKHNHKPKSDGVNPLFIAKAPVRARSRSTAAAGDRKR